MSNRRAASSAPATSTRPSSATQPAAPSGPSLQASPYVCPRALRIPTHLHTHIHTYVHGWIQDAWNTEPRLHTQTEDRTDRSPQVSESERKAIAASFSDKSDPKQVISNGIKISGVKYMTIEASDDSLKAKKVRPSAHADRPMLGHRKLIRSRAKRVSSPTRRHKRCSSATTAKRPRPPSHSVTSRRWASI